MNYLDFSHKIMLYLQLRGILFRFSVASSSDMSAVVENKDGKPFEVSVVGSGNVDINAINGDGIVAVIEEISENGKVRISSINATASLANIEHIKEKTEVLAAAVIGQALGAAVHISEKTKARIMFEPLNACPHRWSAEVQTSVFAIMQEASGIIASIDDGEITGVDIIGTVAAAALARMVVSEGGTARFSAKNGDAIEHAFDVSDRSSMGATISLAVGALLQDYAGVTIQGMGGQTLEYLSEKII